jgi:hypothetical protein
MVRMKKMSWLKRPSLFGQIKDYDSREFYDIGPWIGGDGNESQLVDKS